MSIKKTALATGLGVIVGFIAKHKFKQHQKVTPENVLKRAKDSFKQQGPISGSWIYMYPEKVKKNGLVYDAYRGGITRRINKESKQYGFYADINTGTIISSTPE